MRMVLASALGHLGREDEARSALRQMDRYRSGITVDFVRKHLPIGGPGYIDRILEGLRKAGLAEN